MSRNKLRIQVISVPQCQGVAFEVILVTFRKASRSTKVVENPGNKGLASGKAKSETLLENRTLSCKDV